MVILVEPAVLSTSGSVRVVAMISSLHDEPAAQHAHPTGELEAPRRLRFQLDRRLLERGEELADAEVRDDDLLGAARGLLAVEHQPRRDALLELHLGGLVAA